MLQTQPVNGTAGEEGHDEHEHEHEESEEVRTWDLHCPSLCMVCSARGSILLHMQVPSSYTHTHTVVSASRVSLRVLFMMCLCLQEVDIEQELGVELGLDHEDDEAEEEKHEGDSAMQLGSVSQPAHWSHFRTSCMQQLVPQDVLYAATCQQSCICLYIIHFKKQAELLPTNHASPAR